MMLVEDSKKDINNSLKEIQESTGKQIEALKEETQKSLKELRENTTKQEKELNKTIQDLKMEVETIKKSKREISLRPLSSLNKIFLMFVETPGIFPVSITAPFPTTHRERHS
jgi:DNA anti-recombination protein RmuC